jgi:hypothetical protein
MPINKSLVLRIILIFLISYGISLLAWIQVQDTYGYVMTFVSSKFVAAFKDAKLEEVLQQDNVTKVIFRSMKSRKNELFMIPFKTSIYAFNVPLTLSILASLFLFIRRKFRAYGEAFLLLLIVHFFYIFFLGVMRLTEVFMGKGIEEHNPLLLTVYQFLWGFSEYTFISFGPFLIGIYIFMRFNKKQPGDE